MMLALSSLLHAIIYFVCAIPAQALTGNQAPEVTLNSTRIVGVRSQVGQYSASAYLGIPYAVPPMGQLRFQKTVPLKSLPEVIDATRFKPECVSVYPNDQQSEDCLYLNVWVPEGGSQSKAVMVWIHGGGFIAGSSNNPQGTWLAAENDVIVVSMSYRLGPFGFLSTEDAESRGNYGLWDQHTALQWVHDNIAVFGGNPLAVTVFGESAGGKSVSFQVTSPHSSHLFQRAIIQSGTVLCPAALQWKPEETAVRLAKAVHCPVSSHHAIVDCLRQKSAVDIAFAADKLWDDDPVRKLIDFGWAPVEDGDFVPALYQQDGTLASLSPAFTGSIMLGVNNNEGALLKLWRVPVVRALDAHIESKLHDSQFFTYQFLPKVMAQMFKNLPDDRPSFTTASRVVGHIFTDWSTDDPSMHSQDLYNSFGDQAYVSPSFHFLDQWLKTLSGTVYVYVFDNYPALPAEEGLGGMKHGDDVAYTFGLVEQKLVSVGAPQATITQEATLGENFRKLLTNFAKTGNPGTPQPPSGWPTWPQYDLHHQAYLSLSSTPRVADHYRASNITLWTHLVPTLVTHPAESTATSQTGHAQTCTVPGDKETAGGDVIVG